MNVGELKQLLNKYDDNIEVISTIYHSNNGHGGREEWKTYNTISGISTERYKDTVQVSNNGYLDVDIPLIKIEIGKDYEVPVQPHIFKHLEESGERIFTKNITLTKII